VITWEVTELEADLQLEGTIETTYVSNTGTESYSTTMSELSAEGFTTTVNSETWQTYEFLDDPEGHFQVSEIRVLAETTVLGFTTTVDATSTFDPDHYLGPWSRVCLNETWTTPSVTETITTVGLGTEVLQTESWEGSVESIDEFITVPAGTFECVRTRRIITSGPDAGSYTLAWIDTDTGNLIKQEIHHMSGTLVSNWEATSIE
jgi:hypothetical protein